MVRRLGKLAERIVFVSSKLNTAKITFRRGDQMPSLNGGHKLSQGSFPEILEDIFRVQVRDLGVGSSYDLRAAKFSSVKPSNRNDLDGIRSIWSQGDALEPGVHDLFTLSSLLLSIAALGDTRTSTRTTQLHGDCIFPES